VTQLQLLDLSQAAAPASVSKTITSPIEFRHMDGVPKEVKFGLRSQKVSLNNNIDQQNYVYKQPEKQLVFTK